MVLVTGTMQEIVYVIFVPWKNISGDIFNKFMKGKHVMRHQKGLWNGIQSDMMIETTYMKYGRVTLVKFCLNIFPRFDSTESSK